MIKWERQMWKGEERKGKRGRGEEGREAYITQGRNGGEEEERIEEEKE